MIRKTPYNSTYKKLAVQCLNEVKFFNQTFVQVDKFCASKSPTSYSCKTLPAIMKKTTTIITTFTVLLCGCSDKDNRVTVQDTFGNGQPKTTIYKTIDDKNTYYEIKYDSLGRIKEITPYSGGQLNGTKIYFRDNLEVGALLPHKDGKREGFTYEFYEGQQTAFKGESKNGEFNGLSTWFHKDGRPEETGIRTNGKKEGEWTEYHENGQLKAKGTYINASKQSDWTYWNNDGTIDTAKHD